MSAREVIARQGGGARVGEGEMGTRRKNSAVESFSPLMLKERQEW